MVKFYDILYNLDENNLNNFYSNIKQSNDYKAREFILKLTQKQNIFLALRDFVDETCKIMLNTENPKILSVIGRYLKIKDHMTKKIIATLLYPIFFFVVSLIVILIINQITKISFWEIIIFPFVISVFNIFGLRKILNHFHLLSKLDLTIAFLNNQINFKTFQSIIEKYNIQIKTDKIYNYQNLIFIIIKKNFFDFNDLIEYTEREKRNFNNYCNEIFEQSAKGNVFIISIYVAFIVVKSMYSIYVSL